MKFPRSAAITAAALALALAAPTFAQNTQQEKITINTHAPATPFPHFWAEMFGSPHANIAMRAIYLHDLTSVKKVTDFDYVRFHGILDDGNGVYSEDAHGNPVYNFQLVDQIYDGLLKRGVRLSSKSASCPNSSPSIPMTSMPSGTSRMSRRPGAWRCGMT